MEWWYIKDGQQYGPESTDKIQGLLYSGALPSSARVWTHGFDNWAVASDVDPFSKAFQPGTSRPPVPRGNRANWLLWWRIDQAELDKQVAQYSNLNFAHSARGVAVLCLAFSGAITIAFTAFGMFGMNASSYIDVIIFAILALFIYRGHRWAMLAAMILWTVEKGLIIVDGFGPNHTGSAMALSQVIWWSIYMHAFYVAFRVEQNRKTFALADARQNNVGYKKITTSRHILGIVALVLAIPFSAILIIAAVQLVGTNLATTFETVQSATDVTTRKAAVWRNPLTGSVATLFAGWSPVPYKDDPSTFEFQNGRSVVILGHETLDNSDLGTYLDLLQKNVSYGLLSDKKMQYDGSSGISYYILNYVNAADPSTPANVDVKVWQTTPSSYWRTVVIAPLNEDQHRAEAQALADRLEKTSLDEQ